MVIDKEVPQGRRLKWIILDKMITVRDGRRPAPRLTLPLGEVCSLADMTFCITSQIGRRSR
jgi:hypothetical protein